MLIPALVATVALIAAPAEPELLQRPSAGDYATFAVELTETTVSGSAAPQTVRGRGVATMWCLESGLSESQFVLSVRAAGASAEESGLPDSFALVRLDELGRVLPDLSAGAKAATKVSLDRSGWTAVGLLARVPAVLLREPGHRVCDVEVTVYGEAQRLRLQHAADRVEGGWKLTRRLAERGTTLAIGRQARPTLSDFTDVWMLTPTGGVQGWAHRTELTYHPAGHAALTVRLHMTARRLSGGTLSAESLGHMRADVAVLRPVWEPLVNPEPGELGLAALDIKSLRSQVESWQRRRGADSPLSEAGALLTGQLGRLEQLADAARAEERAVAAMLGKPAPDFTLCDPAGRAVRLSDFRGGPVLLVFWGLGCRLCKVEAPHLTELHDRFTSRGLTVLAVECSDTDPADVRAYMAEKALRHSVLLGGSRIGDRYHIGGLPRAFWLDASGRIVARQTGFESRDTLFAQAEKLLTSR